MNCSWKSRIAAPGVALAVALVAAGIAREQAVAAAPQDGNVGRMLHAVTADNQLLTFAARLPEAATAQRIRGLPRGATLVGLDMRPATGDLYGVGSDSVVYRVNDSTGIARAEGRSFSPELEGRAFGIDFNPTVDMVRVTSDARQNMRLDPDSGQVVAVDARLNPPRRTIVASAYTNSSIVPSGSRRQATETILYGLDAGRDMLCVQNPPNDGMLTGCRAVGIDIQRETAFDIVGFKADSADSNIGYVATAEPLLGGSSLWRLDLATGESEPMGPILTGALAPTVTGMAAVQDER